jgi:enoyl-CoA hydratase/carnithine racemase
MTYHTPQFELPGSLAVELRGETAILRLSRARKRNAIDLVMAEGIGRFFTELPKGIRAVVIHGEGDHFSAGVDLSEISEVDASTALFGSRSIHRVLDKVEQCPVPVIAVLQGAVIGLGLELAAAAHIRVAERGAFYGLPEGIRGIFVGGGAAVRVPRLIGVPRMMDMMLTGRTYGAEDGMALGLSQYLVERGEGLTKAVELAGRIGTNAPLSNYAVLQALPRIARADPDAGFLLESLMSAVAVVDDEAKLRLRAFLEKRAEKVSHAE